jgi:uncharacterized protein YggE
MKTTLPVLVAALCLCMGAAHAQQADKFASGLATAMEGLGQSLGETALSGQSVFVTATGRAPLPAERGVSYTTIIEARAATAVEAAHVRDERISAIEAAARKFGVVIDSQSSSFGLEKAPTNRNHLSPGVSPAHAAMAAPPGVVITPPAHAVDEPPSEPKFIAKTTVKFVAAHPAHLADFLDALREAGADDLQGGSASPSPLNMFQGNTVLGLGAVEKVDESLWDQASRAAMTAARHQAEVLATAAGRPLGEIREVMVLNRGTQGDDATVTLSVRFAFAPGK